MKRVLFTFCFFLVSLISMAQTVNFSLQADGRFTNKADGKDFAVLLFDGKTSQELYANILKAITKLYNSPKDVISKVDGEIISVNGISENCVLLKGMMGAKVLFSIQYVLQFQFKDGKIRVDAPSIARFFSADVSDITPFSGWLNAQSVFKKGEPNPKKQNTIDDFNNTMNGLINNILSATTSKKEEW